MCDGARASSGRRHRTSPRPTFRFIASNRRCVSYLSSGGQLGDLASPDCVALVPMSPLPVAHLVGEVWGWRVMCSTSVGLQLDPSSGLGRRGAPFGLSRYVLARVGARASVPQREAGEGMDCTRARSGRWERRTARGQSANAPPPPEVAVLLEGGTASSSPRLRSVKPYRRAANARALGTGRTSTRTPLRSSILFGMAFPDQVIRTRRSKRRGKRPSRRQAVACVSIVGGRRSTGETARFRGFAKLTA